MKLYMFLAIVCIACWGCDPQKEVVENPTSTQQKPQKEIRAEDVFGGYAKQEGVPESAQKAAQFAVAEICKSSPGYSLVKVLNVETQVVAGTNYKMTLQLTKNGKNTQWDVVVYEDLQGNKELSSKQQK